MTALMPAADSINAHSFVPRADRALMKRLAIALGLLLLLTFAFSRLDLLYSHKFFETTGRAQWIWFNHRIASGDPVACFATRNFDLPPNRYYTRIKIAADPEYTLYFNGQEIGGHRAGDRPTLDIYDLSALSRTKGNRIVVALRSPNGVGGLLVSVDITDDLQNFVVTDATWNIVKRRTPDLLLRDPSPPNVGKPLLFGMPPARRWNYPEPRIAAIAPPPTKVIEPVAAFTFNTALPDIEIIEGVAVMTSKKTIATAYDFGPTSGRARLTLATIPTASRPVKVRYANWRNELFTIEGSVEPFVFAPGEQTVTDTQLHAFRYVMVYGGGAKGEVVR